MNRMHLLLAVAVALGTVFPSSALEIPESRAVRTDRVNVRVAPSREAEVLATLKRGDRVQVLGADSGGWTRIAVPVEVPIWIFGPLVDVPAQKIRAKEANVRSGPGKNYSELGRLKQGDRVTVVRESDGWVQIEPPADLSAFISTGLLTGSGDTSISVEKTGIARNSQTETIRTVETVPERKALPAEPLPEDPGSKVTPVSSEVRSVRRTEVLEAKSPNSNSAIVASPASTVQVPTTVATTPVAPAPPVSAVTSVPPSTPVTTASSYVEGSQALLRYSETVRSVVRVGRVGLSLEPQSPSYFELTSVLRGEGRLGFLVSEDNSIRFGAFRGKVVRVVADEFQTAGSPAKTVLRVKSIVLEPGY
jgi:uncharacterized protein YgiM (DUF1202 family)